MVFFRFSGNLSDSFDSTYADTVLRIEYHPDEKRESVVLGDSRRYPGMLLPTVRRVDVNADGYTDIILAQTKIPGHSVDTITRTLASPAWPVRLTAHVYDPERHRYEGRPYGRIDTDIPPLKALLQGPHVFLRRLVSLNCNADARSDIGLIHQPRLFSIWTAEDAGFSSEPAFEFKSPTDMDKVVFQENLLPDGPTTLVIQGERMVYVFRPTLASEVPESRIAE